MKWIDSFLPTYENNGQYYLDDMKILYIIKVFKGIMEKYGIFSLIYIYYLIPCKSFMTTTQQNDGLIN